jgi:hypothetical protein
MTNSLNITNIKNLLTAAYLAGVHDAFEKSKGLDTISLQKNIDDSLQFREILVSELKSNGISNAESILINAKSKGKELFCEKYPEEMKCKMSTPTNKKEESGILSLISSFFTPKKQTNNSNVKNTNKPVNSLIVRNKPVNSSIVTNKPVNSSIVRNKPVNSSIVTNTPPTNTVKINSLPNISKNSIRVNVPPSVATNVTVPPPSVATNVTVPPPSVATTSVATPNASALNPMVQTQPTIGGKRKSR